MFMTNSYFELLFTNIWRSETIEDCFEDLFSNKSSKSSLKMIYIK